MAYIALLPALLHVYIFWIETWGFGSASSKKAFGVADDQVETVRPWAFNQGWYNLFLSLAIFVGLVFGGAVGGTLILYALASMIAAAVVLVLSNPSKARSAAIQGVPALLGLVGVLWGAL